MKHQVSAGELTHVYYDDVIVLFQCRVVYLMNLDYRSGEINFADLNSDGNYDAAAAFHQSQLANMLTVTQLSRQWALDRITVNAVSNL